MLAPLVQDLLQSATIAPAISVQPQNQTVQTGSSATFSVTAIGVNLTYQWYKNGIAISGATSSTFTYGPTTFPTDSGAQFYVIVTNTAGFVISGVAILLVLTAAVTTFIPPQLGTSANDIVTAALRRINAYMPGDNMAAIDANDALSVLNDLLDSWTIDHNYVYASVENILQFTGNQYQYTIGNYVAGTFSGSLTANSNVITNLIAPANLTIGATITDSYGALPSGSVVVAFTTNSVTVSNPAAFAVSMPSLLTYTLIGDFAIARPLRITDAFTRISGIDFPMDVALDQRRYNEIGLKSQPSPWPVVAWYNPTYPLGNLYFYPNPSSNAELHLFTDQILSEFVSLTDTVNLPQGYVRALKWNLARELCAEYGMLINGQIPPAIAVLAKESLEMVRALNADPAPTATFDGILLNMRHRGDAGWILSGGFR